MKNNWQTKKLGDVINFTRGLTYSKNDEVEFSGTAVLRANNINLGTSSLDFSEIRYIRDDINIPPEKKVQKNSLIITTASGSQSHLGKVALIDKDYNYAFGGFMGQITPKKEINSKYLFYILTSGRYRQYIEELSRGVNINNLKYDQISNFDVSIPDILVQERIVKVLDEVLGKIEIATKNTEKNLQNCHDLFDSYLNNIFINTDNNWELNNLEEVTERITDGSHFSPKSGDKGEYPYITVRDIFEDQIDFKNCKFIDEKSYRELFKNGCQPLPGDVLFSKDGTVGKVSLVNYKKDFVVLSSLAIVTPKKDVILSEYLKYVFKSPFFLNQAIGKKTGTAIKRIVLRNLKTTEIVYPKSLKEQKIIVKKLDELSEQTKKLEQIYKQKLVDLEELKKSILVEAFAGRL